MKWILLFLYTVSLVPLFASQVPAVTSLPLSGQALKERAYAGYFRALLAEGYSLELLQQAGCSLYSLRGYFPLAQLKKVFTLPQLIREISPLYLSREFSLADLQKAGLMAEPLLALGFSPKELFRAGFEPLALCDNRLDILNSLQLDADDLVHWMASNREFQQWFHCEFTSFNEQFSNTSPFIRPLQSHPPGHCLLASLARHNQLHPDDLEQAGLDPELVQLLLGPKKSRFTTHHCHLSSHKNTLIR